MMSGKDMFLRLLGLAIVILAILGGIGIAMACYGPEDASFVAYESPTPVPVDRDARNKPEQQDKDVIDMHDFTEFRLWTSSMGYVNVYRFVDEKAGLVCYLHSYCGGIWCTQISQTKLDY